MSKVEELREKVDRYKVGDYVEHDIEDGYAVRDICVVGTEDLDSLIAAAREEGAAEVLANPISRGTLYVNTGGIGDLPDGQYPVITVLVPKEVNP
jgi:hypothetical protein